MNNFLHFLLHLFGFEKLNKFERESLHEANIQSSLFIGFLAIILESWMLIRQTITKIIPRYLAGKGTLFDLVISNTSKYSLMLIFGLTLMFFCFFQKYKTLSKKQFVTLLVTGSLCVLYSFVFTFESLLTPGETITPVMANIENLMIIISYLSLLLMGVAVVIYAFFKYFRQKTIVILEHLTIILFTLMSLAFGVLVSYSDFWSGKQITCFLMLVIYVGCLLIYRPYITLIILGISFWGFYEVLQTYNSGMSFHVKEIELFGRIHKTLSGDSVNYIMFFVSLSTICFAMYHSRLKEARKTLRLQKASDELEKKNKEAHEQFVQTAEALVTAIDAKDTYTNGHSRRVAQYSEQIARAAGKSNEECEEIYFAALLHDVGKIGVPLAILSKNGRLTDEEFAQIKAHPVAGGAILNNISLSPWLRLGAMYHHERYD